MFETFLPSVKIGCLQPLSVIDNAPYEFYRMAPKNVMAVLIPVGLAEFSAEDVERVFVPLDRYLDQLMERGVDLVIQNGVPLPLLIGLEAHDRMIDHIAEYTGLPATTTLQSVVRGISDTGLRKIAVVNKWSDAMNVTLGDFLARVGVSIVGRSTRSIAPAEFMKIKDEEHMRLAYDLGCRAFRDNPDCDGVYIGGGSWLAEPVAERLEDEFGKPVICNQPAMIRNCLRMLNAWAPRQGFSRIMATP